MLCMLLGPKERSERESNPLSQKESSQRDRERERERERETERACCTAAFRAYIQRVLRFQRYLPLWLPAPRATIDSALSHSFWFGLLTCIRAEFRMLSLLSSSLASSSFSSSSSSSFDLLLRISRSRALHPHPLLCCVCQAPKTRKCFMTF